MPIIALRVLLMLALSQSLIGQLAFAQSRTDERSRRTIDLAWYAGQAFGIIHWSCFLYEVDRIDKRTVFTAIKTARDITLKRPGGYGAWTFARDKLLKAKSINSTCMRFINEFRGDDEIHDK